MELFYVEVLEECDGLFSGELGGLGFGVLCEMGFAFPRELRAAFLCELGVGILGGLGGGFSCVLRIAFLCLRSLVDRACTLAVGTCISFWLSRKFLVLSEPDLLLYRTDFSLVVTVEGGKTGITTGGP